jgi:hypothetical protein
LKECIYLPLSEIDNTYFLLLASKPVEGEAQIDAFLTKPLSVLYSKSASNNSNID